MANTVIIQDEYFVGTAQTPFGADSNADHIENLLKHQPAAPDGYVYMLRCDTYEWQLCELPPSPPEYSDNGDDVIESGRQEKIICKKSFLFTGNSNVTIFK